MRLMLTLSVAAMALLSFAANAPANAQVTFESAYAQPANMLDGVDVGARISMEPDVFAPPPQQQVEVAAVRCQPGQACGGHRRAVH